MRLLVVDDDPAIRRLVSGLLRLYRVTEAVEAEDGSDALYKLAESRFDGVILDINMPGKSGLELASELRADPEFAHLPLYVLSASTDRAHIEHLRDLGVSGYLLKPIRPLEAGRRLEEFVERCRRR